MSGLSLSQRRAAIEPLTAAIDHLLDAMWQWQQTGSSDDLRTMTRGVEQAITTMGRIVAALTGEA